MYVLLIKILNIGVSICTFSSTFMYSSSIFTKINDLDNLNFAQLALDSARALAQDMRMDGAFKDVHRDMFYRVSGLHNIQWR